MFSNTQTNMALILTYRDDFNEYIMNNLPETLPKFLDKYIDNQTIQLPSSLFETLYQSLTPLNDDGGKVIGVTVDWNMLLKNIKYIVAMDADINLDEKSMEIVTDKGATVKGIRAEFIKKIKKAEESKGDEDIECVTDTDSEEELMLDENKECIEETKPQNITPPELLFKLIKYVWTVYMEFMPIEKYGLPGKNILEWLIKCIESTYYGDDLCPPDVPYPYVMKTFDAFNLESHYKIKNYEKLLKNYEKLLKENNIDFDPKLEEDGYSDFLFILNDYLKRNPLCNVVISPTVSAAMLGDINVRKPINRGMIKMIEEYGFKVPSLTFDKQAAYTKTYCDYYFNKKISLDEIEGELENLKLDYEENSELENKDDEFLKNDHSFSLVKNYRRNIGNMIKNAGLNSNDTNQPEEFNRKSGRPLKK
jgi:hypothetical protein